METDARKDTIPFALFLTINSRLSKSICRRVDG